MDELGELNKLCREIRDMPLVMARLFENPRCKPWDLAKGKRFRCCHYLKGDGHSQWCFEGIRGEIIHIPRIGKLSTGELL